MLLAEGFGNAEAGLILSLSSMGLVGVLTFLGRGVLSDLRAHSDRLAGHDTALKVSESFQVNDRIRKLEDGMNDIRSDFRDVKKDLTQVLEIVKSQAGHRRFGDTPMPRLEDGDRS